MSSLTVAYTITDWMLVCRLLVPPIRGCIRLLPVEGVRLDDVWYGMLGALRSLAVSRADFPGASGAQEFQGLPKGQDPVPISPER